MFRQAAIPVLDTSLFYFKKLYLDLTPTSQNAWSVRFLQCIDIFLYDRFMKSKQAEDELLFYEHLGKTNTIKCMINNKLTRISFAVLWQIVN